MAFNTGNSLFGAKPATGSIFGTQSTAPKPQTNLFGNSVPNISTFGTQNQAQPAQGTSLFGGQPQQQGAQAPQPIQPPSLFNQPAQTTQQPASLFGNTQQPQQNTAPGLFSQQGAQAQMTTAQPGFGATTTASNPLFGGASTAPSLFGNTMGSSTNAANPLFGGAPATTNQAFGGVSTSSNPLFGNRQNSQPSAMSFSTSSPAGAVPFTKSTRFNDLPDPIKKIFEDIDTHIQGRIQICNDLKQRKLGDEANKGKDLIRDVHKDLLHTISVIQSDVLQTRAFKSKSDQTVQDTIVATRIVDGYRNQQAGIYLKNHADFPLEFFTRHTEEMKVKLTWCKNAIQAIERELSSLASQNQVTPQAITSTLEAQHSTFITLASRTAAVDAELQKVKALYTQLWRANTGSARDPFNDLDRGTGSEFGLEGLNSAGK